MSIEMTMSQKYSVQTAEILPTNKHLRDIFRILEKSKNLEQGIVIRNIHEAFVKPPLKGPSAHEQTKTFFQNVLISSGGFYLEGMPKEEYNREYIEELATTAGKILQYKFPI